jgi:hypothetical protein
MSNEHTHRRIKHEQRRLEDKLDKMLGFYYWRTYWSTSLWANLATPLNLGITIFTALMTAHSSSSSSFISDDLNMKINISTFFISIINTFFAPQKQFNELNEYLSKWSDLGNTFEKIIFSDSDPVAKITDYISILDSANALHKEQFTKHRNFVTDFLHIIIRILFMNSNDRWMNSGPFEFYEKIQDAGIELEFDFKKFKRDYKNASVLERLCTCFSCCFKRKESPNVSESDTADDRASDSVINGRETIRVQRTVEMTPVNQSQEHTVVHIAQDQTHTTEEYKNPIADPEHVHSESRHVMSTPDIHELQHIGTLVNSELDSNKSATRTHSHTIS